MRLLRAAWRHAHTKAGGVQPRQQMAHVGHSRGQTHVYTPVCIHHRGMMTRTRVNTKRSATLMPNGATHVLTPFCEHHHMYTPFCTHERRMCTSVRQGTDLTETRYHIVADHTLDQMCEVLEDLEEALDMDDYDVTNTYGVLSLDLGSCGSFVINKQAPNKQIWYSSPLTGPQRFMYDVEQDAWVSTSRKDTGLHDFFRDEITELLKQGANISPVPVDLRRLRHSRID